MSLAEDHKIRNSMDITTLVDCGCVATVWNDESGIEIEYCPSHQSSFEIVQSLINGAKLALAELDRIGGDIGFEPDRYRERIKATEVLSRAIRDVEKAVSDGR